MEELDKLNECLCWEKVIENDNSKGIIRASKEIVAEMTKLLLLLQSGCQLFEKLESNWMRLH